MLTNGKLEKLGEFFLTLTLTFDLLSPKYNQLNPQPIGNRKRETGNRKQEHRLLRSSTIKTLPCFNSKDSTSKLVFICSSAFVAEIINVQRSVAAGRGSAKDGSGVGDAAKVDPLDVGGGASSVKPVGLVSASDSDGADAGRDGASCSCRWNYSHRHPAHE